jgi:hypothetical protein
LGLTSYGANFIHKPAVLLRVVKAHLAGSTATRAGLMIET